MTYTRRNVGTCSSQTTVTLDENGVVQQVEVLGGCNGNLKGICQLLAGMRAEDAIAKMQGVTCGFKPTSCPDQIALALKEALARM